MSIIAKINFPVKCLTGQIKQEEATLNLKIPQYYQSKLFEDKSNYIIHRAFQTQLHNKRQGTRNTKTRAEVNGGGHKPWKQKGSGRARAGSNRSPLWKGGGVSFGPRPKNFSNKINRKEWRLSLRLLLLKKVNTINVVENFEITSTKTKDFLKVSSVLNIHPLENNLIIVEKLEENLQRSTKNLKNIRIVLADCLDINNLLNTTNIFISQESLKIIEEKYNV